MHVRERRSVERLNVTIPRMPEQNLDDNRIDASTDAVPRECNGESQTEPPLEPVGEDQASYTVVYSARNLPVNQTSKSCMATEQTRDLRLYQNLGRAGTANISCIPP